VEHNILLFGKNINYKFQKEFERIYAAEEDKLN
jgi:hypothetical protein